MSVFVIAEPGATHEGRFADLTNLVRLAAHAGCNAFKPQWMSDPETVCRRRNAHAYRRHYAALGFPFAWHTYLHALCWSYGMEYGCSSYTPEDRAALDTVVDFHKIASFEALADAPQPLTKRVYIGAGMLDGADLAHAKAQGAVLQCTSAYPTPIESMHLSTIRAYGLAGLSDHSGDIDMGAWAVCAGAKVIEVHMASPESDPLNPDRAVALLPDRLALYIRKIRDAERAMGSPVKAVQACEQEMRRYQVQP